MPTLHLTLPHGIDEFTTILERLDGFLRAAHLPQALIATIGLVADELLTNILSHGDAGNPDSPIEIQCAVEKAVLCLQLRDRGIAFNPLTHPAPRTNGPLSERTVGGLGIHIVSQLMDRVEYRREGDNNCLTLFKRLPR